MDNEKQNILIVDDDIIIRKALKSIISSLGFNVEAAENGEEALTILKTKKNIDMILSDMNMPKMNGLELIKEIKTMGLDAPIIILTVNTEIKIALDAIRNGANDYLLKDGNIKDIVAHSISRVLEEERLKKENIRLMEGLRKRNEELNRLSYLDGLTGIPNRRYFDNVIEQEWRRSKRELKPIALIMIDIDCFKKYNDTYGHQGGDMCLKQVASALNSSISRGGDFISRYGGEEFVAVLPNADTNGAVIVAEKMRSNVIALQILHGGSTAEKYVTISLGVSSVIPSQDNKLEDLISMSDQALYVAKKEGRNRVITK